MNVTKINEIKKQIVDSAVEGAEKLIAISSKINMIGKKINIIGLDYEGKITEVIFGTQNSIHFKAKCWIDFELVFIVLEEDEFTLL